MDLYTIMNATNIPDPCLSSQSMMFTSAIACKTSTKALSAENLQTAFRKTRVYPLDEDAINLSSVI